MMKVRERTLKIGIARFPYGGNGGCPSEHPDIGTWLAKNVPKIKADPRCEDTIWPFCIADTPITMTRNRALKDARENGVDVLLMIDSDQNPDLYLGVDPLAKPFWDSAFDFLYKHYDKGPCVIAAPYCGPPPHPTQGGGSVVYVFRWRTNCNDAELRSFSLEQFSREEAATRAGIEEVAALPTGMCMIDTRACDVVKPPWFKYEWKDEYEAEKASTEDVYFTRNCSLQGVSQYCNWDAWVGHSKPATVGKPVIITADQVGNEFREAVLAGRDSRDRVRQINAGKSPAQIADELGLNPPAVVEAEGIQDIGGFAKNISLVASQLAPLADAACGVKSSVMPRETGNMVADMLDVLGMELRPKFDPDGGTRFGISTPQGDLDALQSLVKTLVEENPWRSLKIVEIGSWLGTSANAMADTLGPQSGTVHCIDTWAGSKADVSSVMADVVGGSEAIFETFKRCVGDRLDKEIVPHRRESLEAARFAEQLVLADADLIYIDAGHSFEEVAADIEAWLPHVRPGGILAGHDYGTTMFPGVTQAVNERGNCEVKGTVWWLRIPTAEEIEGNGEPAAVSCV